MYHYNFIEIGTANFDTLTEVCNDTDRGLAIEPLEYYLNQLPNKPLVTKVNCAISPNNKNGQIDIYYIPEDVIVAQELPWWLKGCNSIGHFHKLHLDYNLQHLVKIKKVELNTIQFILEKYQVHGIDFLKIDTEGSDLGILENLFLYLKDKDSSYFPKKIKFESSHNLQEQNKKVIDLYLNLGYYIDYIDIDDTQLIYKENND